MKKRISSFISIALIALTSGCATLYKEAPRSEPHATIRGEWGESFWDGANTAIYEINGLPVDTDWKGATSKRRLFPGKNSVFVSTGGGQRLTATAYLEFSVMAENDYIVTKENQGEFVLFKIYNEATGEVVAEKKAEKRTAPSGGSPMVIPIVIPAG
jgi:hypothetical protein